MNKFEKTLNKIEEIQDKFGAISQVPVIENSKILVASKGNGEANLIIRKEASLEDVKNLLGEASSYTNNEKLLDCLLKSTISPIWWVNKKVTAFELSNISNVKNNILLKTVFPQKTTNQSLEKINAQNLGNIKSNSNKNRLFYVPVFSTSQAIINGKLKNGFIDINLERVDEKTFAAFCENVYNNINDASFSPFEKELKIKQFNKLANTLSDLAKNILVTKNGAVSVNNALELVSDLFQISITSRKKAEKIQKVVTEIIVELKPSTNYCGNQKNFTISDKSGLNVTINKDKAQNNLE